MSSPTVAQLINPAPLVEQGLKSRFDAQMPDLPCLIPRTTADIPAAFVRLQFTLGKALNHLRPMPDGTFQRDAWHCTLEAVVQTKRDPDPAAPDLHTAAVGRVRALIAAARYDAAFLPWHVLTTLAETGQTESVQVGDDSDLTSIAFAGMICVQSSAWPSD